jgi:hypothetical protein
MRMSPPGSLEYDFCRKRKRYWCPRMYYNFEEIEKNKSNKLLLFLFIVRTSQSMVGASESCPVAYPVKKFQILYRHIWSLFRKLVEGMGL